MPTCPTCRERFDHGSTVCPTDGAALLPDEAFAAADVDLAAGTMVGEYRIEKKIGEGGFGTVYQAVQPLIGKAVAVKVLSRQYSSSPEMVARFISEARAANHIRHRNIVDIFSFGALEDGRQYYAMELLVGATLDDHLAAHGRLGVEEALAILRGVARALDAAHDKGIVHRDLKPENVYLVHDEDAGFIPKLLDFGIAKLLNEGAAGPKTRTGAPIGTPAYMAPEQCRGRAVDRRADVYALGVLAFEALVGARPFSGDVMDLMMQHVQTAPPAPSATCSAVPRELDAPLLAMLEKEPDRRPATASEAIRRLEDAAVAAGVIAPRDDGRARLSIPSARGARAVSASAPTLTPTQAEALALGVTEPGMRSLAGAVADAPAPGRSSRLVAAVAVALGVAAVTAAIGLLGGAPAATVTAAPSAPRSIAAPVVHETATATQASSAPPRGAPAPAASATIELTVRATPPNARVSLDGEALGAAPGPFSIARGEAERKLQVSAEGYKTAELPILPRGDLAVPVQLVKIPRAAPRSELEF